MPFGMTGGRLRVPLNPSVEYCRDVRGVFEPPFTMQRGASLSDGCTPDCYSCSSLLTYTRLICASRNSRTVPVLPSLVFPFHLFIYRMNPTLPLLSCHQTTTTICTSTAANVMHTEKSSRNHVKSNLNQIVFTIF